MFTATLVNIEIFITKITIPERVPSVGMNRITSHEVYCYFSNQRHVER